MLLPLRSLRLVDVCVVVVALVVGFVRGGDEDAGSILLARDEDVAEVPLPTPDQFYRRRFHSAAVAGQTLYIEGGQVSYLQDGDTNLTFAVANATLALDLSQDWSNATVQFNIIDKPRAMPNLNAGILWYHQSEDLIYTGLTGDPATFDKFAQPTPPLSLWTMKPETGGGTWTEALGASASQFQSFQRPTRALTAQGPDSGWALNGQNFPDNTYLPGMVRLDMGGNSISNDSKANAFNQSIESGALQFVPTWGAKGLLLALGGNSGFADIVTSDFIPVYDIAEGKWFNQTPTGDRPGWRSGHCAAGIASSNDTFEIMIHGGYVGMGQDAVDFDQVYVLTLPAFHWVKADYTAQYARAAHTCNPVGGGQILMVGGMDPGIDSQKPADAQAASMLPIFRQDENTMTSKDPWEQSLAVFDIGSLAWKDGYEASPPQYQQAGPIKAYYAQVGNSYEDALDPHMKDLVIQQRTAANNHTSNPITASSHSSVNKGAIAGGVVGGVAGLALIVAAISFCVLKRRRHPDQNHVPLQSGHTSMAPTIQYPSGHREVGDGMPPPELHHWELPPELNYHDVQQLSDDDFYARGGKMSNGSPTGTHELNGGHDVPQMPSSPFPIFHMFGKAEKAPANTVKGTHELPGGHDVPQMPSSPFPIFAMFGRKSRAGTGSVGGRHELGDGRRTPQIPNRTFGHEKSAYR